MPLGNLVGSNKGGIVYNAATKKVVQSPTATTAAVGTSPSAGGVMGALAKATSSNVAGGGLAGLYDRTKAGQTSGQPAQPAAFNYDPTTDPVYQKALAAAQANARVQQGNDVAYLNKRGLLGSDAGNAEIAQIGQNAVSDLEANLLPQLASQAYGRYRDDINQKNTDKQLDMQKGQMLGYYSTPELDKAYADANQAKTAYDNAATPEERIAAHKQADAARAVITQLGGDASLVGADVTASGAAANKGKYGIETAQQRQADIDNARNKRNDNIAAAQSVSAITGKVITPQDDWSGLYRQAANANTPLTMAGDNQKFGQSVQMAELTGFTADGKPTNAKQQQDLANWWTLAANTGKIPDELADFYHLKRGMQTQAAYQFAQGLAQQNLQNLWTQADKLGTVPDQLADMLKIPRGTATKDAQQWQQSFGLQQDSNDLAWINALGKAQDGAAADTPKYDGFTPNQVLEAVKGQFLDKDGDPKVGTSLDKQAVYDAVAGYGLPIGQDDQVMLAMGLSKADIAAFDKASGVAGK